MSAKKSKLRIKRREASSVPMAPMIDMVFLLLVFFMCVSSLSQAGHRVELELPDSTSSEVPRDLSDRIILSIQDDGALYLGGAHLELNVLQERLTALRERYPEIKLRIRADKETPYSEVKKAMQVATAAGIVDYIYGAYQGE